MSGEAVSIKGTRNGLVILVDPGREYEEIKSILRNKMESARGFFKGAKFAVYGPQAASGELCVELEDICRQYGLIPSVDICWPPANKREAAVKTREKVHRTPGNAMVLPLHQAKPSTAAGENALLIQRTLRSGQKITSESGVVVLGDIHAGAEVISGGSVLIAGACYGSIQAGTNGEPGAVVLALKLKPTMLKIGNITAESTTFPGNNTGPWIAYRRQNKIFVVKQT